MSVYIMKRTVSTLFLIRLVQSLHVLTWKVCIKWHCSTFFFSCKISIHFITAR